MAVNRKKSFDEMDNELFNLPAFKFGNVMSDAVENMVFNNEVALSVNLEESFTTMLNWKKTEKKKKFNENEMKPDTNYSCHCMGPTENELKNAMIRYHKATQEENDSPSFDFSQEIISPKFVHKIPSPKVLSPKVSSPSLIPTVAQKISSNNDTTLDNAIKTKLESKPEIQKPEIQKPSLGFSSARDEIVRQAVANNKPVPSIISNPPRRYLGNKLIKSKAPVPSEEQDLNSLTDDNENRTVEDERLKGIDPKFLERIKMDVLVKPSNMDWDDIKGLEFAKETMMEAIVYPLQCPELFTGLRRPPKGLLMFGPPGTGKTLIAKCVASNAEATFFNVSASTLTSKWIGEGEMMVRALFAYARVHQPSVIFIDEVDSLLCQRSDSENEGTRRLKTEFLIALDGCGTGDNDQVLLIGATNRPQELDEAARRRFTKRLYIPLPEKEARRDIILHYLRQVDNSLTNDDVEFLSNETNGFSGADLKVVAENAGYMPMRDMIKKCGKAIKNLKKEDIPPVTVEHWKRAIKGTRPSVSQEDLKQYLEWDEKFGSSNCD